MYLFPIVDRSSFLAGDSADVRAVSTIAMSLSGQVVEATLALNHFISFQAEEARRNATHTERSENEWSRSVDERRAIEKSIRESANIGEFDHVDWDRMRISVDMEILKRKVERGEEPMWYAFHRPFLFAKSFVFCLDRIHRMIGVCQHYDISRSAAEAALGHIDGKLSDLREFRNSLAHFEDRVRGYRQIRRERKNIELQPLDTPLIKADDGVLVLECMEGNVFRSILADGSLGAIPIRPDSMQTVQEAVQMFLDALPWENSHARLVPSP